MSLFAQEIRQETLSNRRVCLTNPFIEFKHGDIDQSIPDRFEQQVMAYPSQIAIQTNRIQLSYNELNQAANSLAQVIRSQVSGGELRVALWMEHDAPLIVAMLGVLKAGGTCIPLEPSYPEARAAYILKDSQPDLIVTSSKNLAMAQQLVRGVCQVLEIDRLDSTLSTDDSNLHLSPDTLAYVLYTSGTTGYPKGVVHNHRNALRNVMAYTNGLQICRADRVPLLASCSFGLGMATTLSTLLNGATLYPYSIREEGLDNLAGWLIREEITLFISAATVFRHLARTLIGREEFPHIRLIRLGGERVYRGDVELYKKYFAPQCVLVNALSTTETGNFTNFLIDKETEISGDTVPVGYPVQGMEVLLLDDSGEEVKNGCAGEIAVKSRHLFQEYWRKPEQTKAALFPLKEGDNERIYRTGDMGRKRPDGALEHLGRKDFQVRIRGFRVELEEIETILRQHPAVQLAVVDTQEDSLGDSSLVAYVVPCQDQTPTSSELRDHLKQNLPDHMLPAGFVFLDVLPMTPNGKVDRKMLSRIDQTSPETTSAFVAPRGPVEEIVTRIWTKVLGLKQAGVHDSFFDVGGHSLTATQVTSRVRSEFGLELTLQEFSENSTIAKLAERIERHVASRKRSLICPIRPAPRDQDLPPSFAQQRLWFLDQLEPKSSFYNISRSLALEGVLNLEALRKSLSGILDRHEVLRTTIHLADENPTQVVGESKPCPLSIVDLSEGQDSQSQRQEAMCRILDTESKRPFDLSRDLMVRATLIRLGPTKHVLLLVTHHIASDGWSSGILWQELATLYAAFSRGEPDPLPEMPIQYADYAVWQRQWLQGKVLETQLSYWTKQLSNTSVLELPTDRPRPAVQSYRGARQSLAFTKVFTDQLQALSRKEGVTFFMTLLAALQTLLHRYSGQEDIAVGTPIAGRTRSETEGLIGFFVNTLVLRSELSANPTFRELLARVRKVALEAYEHQDLPFEKLVEELHPDRDLSRSPLFQVMFAHQNVPRQTFELPGLTVSPVEINNYTAKFDLSLYTTVETQGLKACLEYNTDLFDAATVKRMLGHFEVLLEGIVANPDQRLSELPILTSAERHQLLVEWNDTKTDYPNDKCIHELFEAQVEQTPDAVAVVFEDKQLTYRELNERANQLAHHLRNLGVGPEVLVGICVERSLEMVAALLGILKSGGAYVPLDPTYPSERLAFMLADAQPSVLLTQRQLVEKLSSHKAPLVCLEAEWTGLAGESQDNPVSDVAAANLAYVIYTSGSTGKPKGVPITHRALVNFLHSMRLRPGLVRQDTLLAVTTISFDIAILELYLPLAIGARVVIMRREGAADGRELSEKLSSSGTTVMQATPATWRLLLEAGWEGCKQLRILCGGEALSRELANQLLDKGDSLWNLYGPTETTVWSAVYPVESSGGMVFTGRPIANTQIYLLDSNLQPVPIGVAGELCIGGVGLARDYLNLPDLTAEKFIPNPFSDEHGMRLYKTGDLARYLPDGNIELLGRVDYQVKIRGFRIELGEIENLLSQQPAVREAVVVAREDVPGEKRLVGYVVPSQEPAPLTSELRAFLQQKLPDYMVPSAFVLLQSLPLTPNGKIDRQALPVPDQSRTKLESSFVAPRNQVEELVAGIWAQVLKLEQVGIQDNFFELGGHSLLATQVISRVGRTFQVEPPLRSFFETPTVAGLAMVIVKALAEETDPAGMPFLAEGLESPTNM